MMAGSLSLLIEYAKKYIPFYKQMQFLTKIEDFPFVNKTIIMNNYSAFISNENPIKKQLVINYFNNYVSHTRGLTNEIARIEDIIIEETSGTSGTPFLCAKSVGERSMISLALFKQRKQRDKMFSPKLFFPFSHIGLDSYDPHAYEYNLNNLDRIYKMISDQKIRWIHASPSCLAHHIDILEKGNVVLNLPNLKFIECNGSFLSALNKKRIEEYFNVKVINHYGCIETWPIALSCKLDNMHVNEQVVYLEIIDENNNVITEANRIGRIVVTTLVNRFFPLIRYSLGDFGMLLDMPCGCGDFGKVIKLVEGREINIIRGLPRTEFGNVVFRRLIGEVKLKYSSLNLSYIQIIQDQTHHLMIYINDFDNNKEFISELMSLLYRDLQVEYQYDVIILSETEVYEKQNEKPNLFLCKIQ